MRPAVLSRVTCSCLIDHRHLERKWRPLASVIGHVRTRVGLFLRRHGLENPVLHLECGASDRSVLSLSLYLSGVLEREEVGDGDLG